MESIKGRLKVEKEMDSAFTSTAMEISLRENLRMGKEMEKEYTLGKKVTGKKHSILKIDDMAES